MDQIKDSVFSCGYSNIQPQQFFCLLFFAFKILLIRSLILNALMVSFICVTVTLFCEYDNFSIISMDLNYTYLSSISLIYTLILCINFSFFVIDFQPFHDADFLKYLVILCCSVMFKRKGLFGSILVLQFQHISLNSYEIPSASEGYIHYRYPGLHSCCCKVAGQIHNMWPKEQSSWCQISWFGE